MKIKYKINTVHFSIGMNKYRHSWPACRLLQQGINILIIANYFIFKKLFLPRIPAIFCVNNVEPNIAYLRLVDH